MSSEWAAPTRDDEMIMEVGGLFNRTNVRLHQIARYVRTDPEAAMSKCRVVTESILNYLFESSDEISAIKKENEKQIKGKNRNIKNLCEFLNKYPPFNPNEWKPIAAKAHSISDLCSPAMHLGDAIWDSATARNAFGITKTIVKSVFDKIDRINRLAARYYCDNCSLSLFEIDADGHTPTELAICLDCRLLFEIDFDEESYAKRIKAAACVECHEHGLKTISSLLLAQCDACGLWNDLNDVGGGIGWHEGGQFRDTDKPAVRAIRGEGPVHESQASWLLDKHIMGEDLGLGNLTPVEAIILRSTREVEGERMSLIPVDVVISLIDGKPLGKY